VTRDFTLEMYRKLLDTLLGAGYEPLTVRDYLGREDLPEQFVVCRHDVDRKPANARKMARLEADRGVASTYYLRTNTFSTSLARTLTTLSHEVGYHYEDFVREGGELEPAHERFARNLEEFRRVAPVDTVCMHGNPLSPHDNREMWLDPAAPDLGDYDLLGEAYLSMDFESVTYFSDTGRTWRDGSLKIRDHTMGEGDKTVTADGTSDLVTMFADRRVPQACLLAHPSRWADNYRELLTARVTDGAVNVVKRGLNLIA
jgi:hypothetical protein